MNGISCIGQRFGNRMVIKDKCVQSDWTDVGLKIPSRPDKYKLTQCTNCGKILPCSMNNLRRYPPKRCVFCSNVGNHSGVQAKTNQWVVSENYAACNVLYNNRVITFYIDADAYDRVSKRTWRISMKKNKAYVVSGSARKHTMVYLHSMIFGVVPDGMEIDHIDGNSLNNRIGNLRAVTHQENVDNIKAARIDNQIGIRGITYNHNSKKYKVDFYYHGSRYYTKEWDTIDEAVWCRVCFEDHFGLGMARSNPLVCQYLNVEDDKRHYIHNYVSEQILRNERYHKFTPPHQATKKSASASLTSADG